jgi:predicted regulator of Ras-like GTPase activity (Roadblock/LC7/MglB family)
VPYLAALERLLRAVRGAQAALLLDALGEVVVEAGARDDRHRLIGAYQGIGLAAAQRTMARYAGGGIRHILCRYTRGAVILRPLKDGYYLVVALGPEAGPAQGLWHSAHAQEELDAAL